MCFTPHQGGWISGWIFLAFFRFFVGFGNAGLIAVDIPLVQEFVPTYKRGWVSGLTTVLLPAGNMHGRAVGAPIWRRSSAGADCSSSVFSPALLVLMIRYWVPESPRWLIRMGRMERREFACLGVECDPEGDRAADHYPTRRRRRGGASCSGIRAASRPPVAPGLSQTGGVGFLCGSLPCSCMVLKITPAEASYLMICVGLLGIVGRLVASWMSDAFGRRWSGFLIGIGRGDDHGAGRLFHDVYVGTVSVFFVLIMIQRFFGDGSYAIIGPYLAEVWPNPAAGEWDGL